MERIDDVTGEEDLRKQTVNISLIQAKFVYRIIITSYKILSGGN